IPRSLMAPEPLPSPTEMERFRTSILASFFPGELLRFPPNLFLSPRNGLQASQIREQSSLAMALPKLGPEKELQLVESAVPVGH
ncbi:hypothetical protein CDAR_321551, partial [Caerostris darwini]